MTLEDSDGYFPPYYAIPLINEDILKEYPELKDVIDRLGEYLTDQVMQGLNYQVDEEGGIRQKWPGFSYGKRIDMRKDVLFNMDIRVLGYFLTIAREENITEAAALLPSDPAHAVSPDDAAGRRTGRKAFHQKQHRIVLTEQGMLLRAGLRRSYPCQKRRNASLF